MSFGGNLFGLELDRSPSDVKGTFLGKETSVALTGTRSIQGRIERGDRWSGDPMMRTEAGYFRRSAGDARRGEASRHSSPDFPWRPYFIQNYQWSTSSWFIASTVRCAVDRANTVTFGIRQRGGYLDENRTRPLSAIRSLSALIHSRKNLRKSFAIPSEILPTDLLLFHLYEHSVQLQLPGGGISARATRAKTEKPSGRYRSRK